MIQISKHSAAVIFALCSIGVLAYVSIAKTARPHSVEQNRGWVSPTQYDSTIAHLDRAAETQGNTSEATVLISGGTKDTIVRPGGLSIGEKYSKQYPYAQAFPYQSPQIFAAYNTNPKTLYVRIGDNDTALRALTELDEHLFSFGINTHTLQTMGVVFVFEHAKSGNEPLIHE